jgi:hypothetical protein
MPAPCLHIHPDAVDGTANWSDKRTRDQWLGLGLLSLRSLRLRVRVVSGVMRHVLTGCRRCVLLALKRSVNGE